MGCRAPHGCIRRGLFRCVVAPTFLPSRLTGASSPSWMYVAYTLASKRFRHTSRALLVGVGAWLSPALAITRLLLERCGLVHVAWGLWFVHSPCGALGRGTTSGRRRSGAIVVDGDEGIGGLLKPPAPSRIEGPAAVTVRCHESVRGIRPPRRVNPGPGLSYTGDCFSSVAPTWKTRAGSIPSTGGDVGRLA
jgi:hypothetical protein